MFHGPDAMAHGAAAAPLPAMLFFRFIARPPAAAGRAFRPSAAFGAMIATAACRAIPFERNGHADDAAGGTAIAIAFPILLPRKA